MAVPDCDALQGQLDGPVEAPETGLGVGPVPGDVVVLCRARRSDFPPALGMLLGTGVPRPTQWLDTRIQPLA